MTQRSRRVKRVISPLEALLRVLLISPRIVLLSSLCTSIKTWESTRSCLDSSRVSSFPVSTSHQSGGLAPLTLTMTPKSLTEWHFREFWSVSLLRLRTIIAKNLSNSLTNSHQKPIKSFLWALHIKSRHSLCISRIINSHIPSMEMCTQTSTRCIKNHSSWQQISSVIS